METVLYWITRAGLAALQLLPLRWVARLGRAGGAIIYLLDARHRRVALDNLDKCFGQSLSPRQVRALARENFRRIGENFASAVKTGAMSAEELRPHLELVPLPPRPTEGPSERLVVAIGHFGNFEIYARIQPLFPQLKLATTYRALPHPAFDRLLGELRAKSGCRFFERRSESPQLRAFMLQPGVVLGLLADQNAGASGLRVPFLGHECSTSAAPAVFAQRYEATLLTAICYRVALAQWRIEFGPPVPTLEAGKPRSPRAIMEDVNRTFEAAVHRDPANWFWVHNRWKARRFRPNQGAPADNGPQPIEPAT